MNKSFFLALLILLFATACDDDSNGSNDIAESLTLSSPSDSSSVLLDSLENDSLKFEWNKESELLGNVIYTVILDKSSNITTQDEDDGSVLRYDVYNRTHLSLSYNFLDSLPHFQTIHNDTLKADSLHFTVFVRNSSVTLRSPDVFIFELKLKSEK